MTPDTKDRLAGEEMRATKRCRHFPQYPNCTCDSVLCVMMRSTANPAGLESLGFGALAAYDPDREQRMVEALRGALVVIDTLPWPSEAEAGRKVLDALTKRRAAIVAALASFNTIEKASP